MGKYKLLKIIFCFFSIISCLSLWVGFIIISYQSAKSIVDLMILTPLILLAISIISFFIYKIIINIFI